MKMLTMTAVQEAIDTRSYRISLQLQKEGRGKQWNLSALVNSIKGNVVRERHETSLLANNGEQLVIDAIISGKRFRFVWTRVQLNIVLLQVCVLPLPAESQSARIDAIKMAA
jgi:hypothetical protein